MTIISTPYDSMLNDYYRLLFPEELDDNEYVRIIGFDRKEGAPIERYAQSYDEFQGLINKYRSHYSLYVELATVKGKDGGTADKLIRRQVLFFDFDGKDYPEIKDGRQLICHLKQHIPNLFNHCIVKSGNGFHVYVAFKSMRDQRRIAKLNKDLAVLLGADLKACLSTQIARIPTTYNYKDAENPKRVLVATSTIGSDRHKPYKVGRLEWMAEFYQRNIEPQDTSMSAPSPILEFDVDHYAKMYCIEWMMQGVPQGYRNFALGRITQYLKIQGYTKNKALHDVLAFNLKCSPPKPESAIEADFDRYWEKNYNLLGCVVPDADKQQFLESHCDHHVCAYALNNIDTGREKIIQFNCTLLEDTLLRKLTGSEYLILTALQMTDNWMPISELKQALTPNVEGKKMCKDIRTIKKALDNLLKKRLIEEKPTGESYRLRKQYNAKGYTLIKSRAYLELISRNIQPKDYVVYLCIARNLQQSKSVTLDSLARDLDVEKSVVQVGIARLHKAHVLIIQKRMGTNGRPYNHYQLRA